MRQQGYSSFRRELIYRGAAIEEVTAVQQQLSVKLSLVSHGCYNLKERSIVEQCMIQSLTGSTVTIWKRP